MTDQLFNEIKTCCRHDNKALYEEFCNGIITFESLAAAYDIIIGGKPDNVDKVDKQIGRTEIASRCAVLCYRRTRKTC